MDKAYPSKTSMVVRSLDRDKDPFRPKKMMMRRYWGQIPIS
jgi:hypothetical protein